MGTGFVAEAIDAFRSRESRHSGGAVLPGLVSGADLASYSATWEQPALLDWHGVTSRRPGSWGQGPSLLQLLAMLDQHGDRPPWTPTPRPASTRSPRRWKLALADREAWYGDRSPVPLEALLSATTSRRARR